MASNDAIASTAQRSEPLVEHENSEVIEDNFYKKEIKTMCSVGWPMLVSFFCRFGMASEDSAFVGHITSGTAKLLNTGPTVLRNGVVWNLGAALLGYGFLAVKGTNEGSVGYGPVDYLAAAGLSDMVTNILIIPPLAFNQSLNALVSQAMGSGNKKMAGTWLQLSLIWMTLGYGVTLASFFFVSPMLKLLGFTEDVCELAGMYAKYNIFWPIPNGWYQSMRFYFQAQGITKPAMYNNIIFLAINALLNWIFVFGGPFRAFGWYGFGFIGAALSLSCSRTLQPLAYWLYMFWWRKAHLDTWPSLSQKTYLTKEHVKNFMAMSLPQMGTLIFQAFVGQATTLMIAKLGEEAVAASSAAAAATMVFTGGLSPTLSMVGGMRVGYYLGQGQGKHAKRVGMLALLLGAMMTAVIAAIYLPCGKYIMHVVSKDEKVDVPATTILPAIMMNLIASIIVSVGTQGILTSQGRTKAVTFLSMGFELPFSVGCTALMVFYVGASLNLVYWAQAAVSWVEAAVILFVIRRSDWAALARQARSRQGVEQPDQDAETGQGRISTFGEMSDDLRASGISLQEPHAEKDAGTEPSADAPSLIGG